MSKSVSETEDFRTRSLLRTRAGAGVEILVADARTRVSAEG